MMSGWKGIGASLGKAIAEGRIGPDVAGSALRDIGALERLAPKRPPIDVIAIHRVHRLLRRRNLDPSAVSITVPEADFLALADFTFNGDTSASKLRCCDIEILRGRDGVMVWLNPCIKMVESDRKALEMEILRCLGWDSVAELPQSASGNGVSPSAKAVGEIGVAPGAASGNDRNPDGFAHLSNEAKIIAAKAAIARYAREKKLPSAEHLALFRELDSHFPRNKGSRRSGIAMLDDIDRNDHSLSSESLGRAADQAWIREGGAPYRHLIGTAAQRLAEVVNAGDAAADGERA